MSDKLAIIQSEESKKEIQEIIDSAKILITTFKEVVREANKVNNSFKAGKAREYADAIRDLTTVTSQFSTIERQLADALARTARLETQMARTATEQARTRRELAAALREESLARQQLEREQRQNTNTTNQNSSAHRQLTLQVRAARQTARDYGAQIINLNESLRNGSISQRDYRDRLRDLQRNFNLSTREANRLQRELNRLNQATTPSGQRNGSLWGRVTDILKAAGIMKVIDMVTSSIVSLGQSAIGTAIKLDTLRMAQMSVFKSSDEVGKQNEFLTKIAEQYGIEIIGLTDAYTKFSASAQGTTLEGVKSQQIFDAVTKSSAMLGVSTDETTGILRALGQMMSKGKVQAEELRGQLGDRMAGAFRLFADGMGISTAQLDEMLKKGEVLAEEVLPKFATQLNKKYTLGIGEEIDTNQANLNRIANEWTSFVEAVEGQSGIVSSAIRNVSTAIVTLLQALKPSTEINAIKQQQEEFNILGIKLRQNWEDQNKRKEIIDQMIALNPLFLNGLDREKVTLEEISKRIQDVNAQYVQKLILQEQEEKISELVRDQAENYKELAKIISDNAILYNSFGDSSKRALDQFSSGAINYEKAELDILFATRAGSEERRKAISILKEMNLIYEKETWNWFNRIRGIKDTNSAIKDATGEYNGLVNATNRLFGVQGQLLNMNGLLAQSFNKTGQAVNNQKKQFEEIFKVAEGQGKTIALVNNVWREKVNGKWTTTDKKQTEGWYEEYGKLVKRKSMEVAEKVEKPKAATLTPAQKDFINTASGVRDKEIAIQKQKRLDLLISEEDYWKEYENIVERYNNKIQAYLRGKNAKEIQVEGAAFKRAVDAREQSTKEIYDIRSKKLEEQNKKEINLLERASKNLDENDYLTDTEKLTAQIDIDNQIIEQLSKTYKEQIDLATKSAQSTIELERKRDEEIGKVQDNRLKRQNDLFKAYTDDLDRTVELSDNLQNVNYETKRLEILKMRIPLRDQEFLLNRLDLEKERESLLNQRNTNNLKLTELDRIAASTKLTREQQKEYSQIESETASINANLEQTEQNISNLDFSKITEGLRPVADMITNGFNDLGLNQIADQFTAMYQKILEEGKNFSLSNKEIFQAATAVISDFANMFINKQKESTIASLDEQLKYTQETTEQELEFINGRLEQLNALEELTAEQMAERNRLEDEARTYKEQQMQREKLIETQKAKAEQKAAAQQALINGALAATMTLAQMGFIAGAIPAALALAFGVAQSIAISSKDPVPKYFVGRKGGKAEMAITQDGGRELITNQKGEIVSLGSDKGDQLTWLNKGDNVHTAKETKDILKNMVTMPKIGDKVFGKIAMQSLMAPQFNIINKKEDNSDEIAKKVGKEFEKALKRYDKPVILKKNGCIIEYRGANLGLQIGEYDENGNETYYS